MDPKLKIAAAAGITGERMTRWADTPEIQRKKDTDYIFYLEGPIVGNATEDFFEEGAKGFTTPNQLRTFLKENEGNDVEININSPGGSVFDANMMVSDLLQHEGSITIRVSGLAASAAADFLTIPNAKRIAMPGSMIMIHNASAFAFGDSNQMRKVVDRLEKMNSVCIDRFVKATEFDEDDLKDMMDAETWFTDQEALTGGLVDELYEEEDVESENDEDIEATERALRLANDTVAHRIAAIL